MKLRIKNKKRKQLDLINYWIKYRMISRCTVSHLYDTKDSGVATIDIEGKNGRINEVYVFYNGRGILKIDGQTHMCFSSYNETRYMLNNFNLSNKEMRYIEKHMINPYFPVMQDLCHIHDDEYPYIRIHRFLDPEDLEDQDVWDNLYEDLTKEKK